MHLSLHLQQKNVFFRICGNFKSAKKLGPQITKKLFSPQIANPQIATFAEVLPIFVGPQVCGTYLRIAHLCCTIVPIFMGKKQCKAVHVYMQIGRLQALAFRLTLLTGVISRYLYVRATHAITFPSPSAIQIARFIYILHAKEKQFALNHNRKSQYSMCHLLAVLSLTKFPTTF